MNISSVAILSNPKAGKGFAQETAKWLGSSLEQLGISSHIFEESWPNHFDRFSDVWIIGGDGTLNYFINQYPDCQLPLALFKCGTGNDFAWKLYGNKDNSAIFEQVIQAKIQAVDACKINQWWYLNCLGIGFDGEIIRFMQAIRFLGGHLGYLLAVVLKVFSFKEKYFQITTATKSWQERYLLVIANNSSRSGGGFFVTPTANLQDGYVDLLLCGKLNLLQRLKYLPVLQKGKHLHLPFVTHRLVKEVKIQLERETDIQIDGELISAKDIQISVVPNKFNFRF
ncbi:MAG: diacylglycerol kinase family protein [Sediminibacterium sp.]